MPLTVFTSAAGLILTAGSNARFLVLDAQDHPLTPEPVGLAQAFRVLDDHQRATRLRPE
jgi:hypothetical protein